MQHGGGWWFEGVGCQRKGRPLRKEGASQTEESRKKVPDQKVEGLLKDVTQKNPLRKEEGRKREVLREEEGPFAEEGRSNERPFPKRKEVL